MYNFGIQCKGENPTFASILLSPEWRPLTLPRLHFRQWKTTAESQTSLAREEKKES